MLRTAALAAIACTTVVHGMFPLSDSIENFTPETPVSKLVLPPLSFYTLPEAADVAELYRGVVEGVTSAQFVTSTSYQTRHNGMTHVVLRQQIHGLPVFNADVQLNIRKDGSVSSAHDRSFKGPVPPTPPQHRDSSLSKAIGSFAKFLGEENVSYLSARPIGSKLGYMQDGDQVKLVWDLDVQREFAHYSVLVDANSLDVVSLNDYTHFAREWTKEEVGRYHALQRPNISPLTGHLTFADLPTHDYSEGGIGYHQYPGTAYNDTRGNNCYAQENLSGSMNPSPIGKDRPEGTWENNVLVFDDDADFDQQPGTYTMASVLNCFTWVNELHDIWYAHGFDEVSGNFQMDNFGRGGLGNDAVWAFAQDGRMSNNAMFSTPPDGSHGQMLMFEFTMTNPRRDSGFDNNIVTHEFAHGLSNRLTGGPANSNCLSGGQAGGMGEGWGDLFGLLLSIDHTTTRETSWGTGMWVLGQPLDGGGVRGRKFCLDDSCNNGRYSDNNNAPYAGVHAKGELWCNFAYEVYWNLRDKHGYNEDPYTTTGGKKFFTLLLDGMKLQPCNPNFIQARDAILESEETTFDNDDRCEIWCGFARRGLGVSAQFNSANSVSNGYDVPADCENTCRAIYTTNWPYSDP